MLGRLIATAGLTLGLLTASPLAAQNEPDVNETGWRAANSEELELRKAFERGKKQWSKKDGERQMYDCMIAWAIWATTAREFGDMIPTISGDLTHSFAEAQLSHYMNTLVIAENGDFDSFVEKMVVAGMEIDKTVPLDTFENNIRYMGKCFVHPSSWNINPQVTITGPEFMRDVLQQPATDTYPPYVRDIAERQQFDRLILQKDFVGAANLGTRMHVANRKTTIYWNEVLATAELAVSDGKGTLLDDALLIQLEKSWYPKYKRSWARNLLQAKRGVANPGFPPAKSNPYEEPGWAKQERERYLRGETNYTPCNMWNRYGC